MEPMGEHLSLEGLYAVPGLALMRRKTLVLLVTSCIVARSNRTNVFPAQTSSLALGTSLTSS